MSASTTLHTNTRSGSRPTLAKIASESGYSVSTVSAVLNNRADCWASKATRKQVQEVAKRLGYRPNMVARSLQGGRTWTLGVITSALNVEITSEKIQTFERLARETGYITMMAFAPNTDPAVEDTTITRLLDRNVDGLVVYPSEFGQHKMLKTAIERQIPLVTLDGHGRVDLLCDDVSMSYHAAGRLQARHLMDLGHRRLVQINTLPTCYAKDQLRQGFVDEASDAGLPEPMLWDIDQPHDAGNKMVDSLWMSLVEKIKQHRGSFDAVASYDLVAAGVMRAAHVLGIDVPQEFSVIGSDDVSSATNGQIPLTTVAQPVKQIGEESFRLLQRRIEHHHNPQVTTAGSKIISPCRLLLEPKLIVRHSTSLR